MAKFIIAFISMAATIFGLSQSVTFECDYLIGNWGSPVGTIYYCTVKNTVSITSIDAAQIDGISGTHLSGYNDDKVEAFQVNQKGQIHYFPRGLSKFFKNLKVINFYNTGLKEIHQSDLRQFPKLVYLTFHTSNLEVLEENLFEFNPNLEIIYLSFNKISHIDPNVFDKLAKLNSLYLSSNTCINIFAGSNPTEVQNVIKAAKTQCISSDYSNLNQKVKNLEIESKTLSSEDLREKLENLENEIKNSSFASFFQDKLQSLKAIQIEKAKEATTTTTQQPTTTKVVKFGTHSAFESKVIAILKDLLFRTDNIEKQNLRIKEQNSKIQDKVANIEEKLGSLERNMENIIRTLNVAD